MLQTTWLVSMVAAYFVNTDNSAVAIAAIEVEYSEFETFKKDVISELHQLRANEQRLEEQVRHLTDAQTAKDSRIETLEDQLLVLQGECRDHSRRDSSRTVSRRQNNYGQIAFTAYLNHGVHNITQEQPIKYNKILLNDGDGYDPTTGYFTAPMSGVYLFSYAVGAKALPNVPLSQYDVFTRLVVEGQHQVSVAAESTDPYDDEQGSSTVMVYVQEGARVWTIHENRGGNNLFGDNSERLTSFAGTLLYSRDDFSIVG